MVKCNICGCSLGSFEAAVEHLNAAHNVKYAPSENCSAYTIEAHYSRGGICLYCGEGALA